MRVKKDGKILRAIKRKVANWTGHVLRRNCRIKHAIEGKIAGSIEVMGRRERRGKQLLDGLKERRGCWKLKEQVLARARWKLALAKATDLSQERLQKEHCPHQN